MRWSPKGAHFLLQVRAKLLDDRLIDGYQVDYPRFRGQSRLLTQRNECLRRPRYLRSTPR